MPGPISDTYEGPDDPPDCKADAFKHDWREIYYGYECRKCGAFVAHGCEPWAPDEDESE